MHHWPPALFHRLSKKSTVTPLLKKPSLDPDNLSNYRPISNLSFLSKLTERIVKNRLDKHLSTNSLYNTFQSAYTKFHSTETALLALYDHLVRATTRQHITCLCLLDMSAAFDTNDHSILLDRLTRWFCITDIVTPGLSLTFLPDLSVLYQMATSLHTLLCPVASLKAQFLVHFSL